MIGFGIHEEETLGEVGKPPAPAVGQWFEQQIVDLDDGDIAWSDAHANFLSSLSQRETRDLLASSRQVDLKPRQRLFQAGDQSVDVYIVAQGCVRLFQVSPAGKEAILWLSFPGELFGVAEIWSGRQRQVYAVANEATRVHSIRRQDFIQFLGAHPEAAMKAIGILSARVRALGQTLGGLASENVETRLARLLLRFAALSSATRCTAAVGEGEICVNVRLRHQDIANLIGASRQTVTTNLLRLREQGTIRMVDHHVHIAAVERLRDCLI